MDWSEDCNERDLLNTLAQSNSLNSKKKPLMNGTLYNPVTQEEYSCDLIWPSEKLVFLTAENQDFKQIIIDGGWIALCGSDDDLSIERFIEMIPEA